MSRARDEDKGWIIGGLGWKIGKWPLGRLHDCIFLDAWMNIWTTTRGAKTTLTHTESAL